MPPFHINETTPGTLAVETLPRWGRLWDVGPASTKVTGCHGIRHPLPGIRADQSSGQRNTEAVRAVRHPACQLRPSVGGGFDRMMLIDRGTDVAVINLPALWTVMMAWKHEDRVAVRNPGATFTGRRNRRQPAHQQQRDADTNE